MKSNQIFSDQMEKRTIGITGGNGRIGTILQEAFKNKYRIISFDLNEPKEKDPLVDYRKLDCSVPSQVEGISPSFKI